VSERTALYRMFGVDDELLYIGISKNFGRRWEQHARKQPWWDEVVRQTVEWRPTRDEAERDETAAIKAEHPKYNILHAVRPEPEPDLGCDLSKRYVGLSAWDPGINGNCGGYDIDGPDVIAPGTYRITFAYDPDAEPFEAVSVTECVLLDGGDIVSTALGGKVRPPAPPPADGEPWMVKVSLRDALGRALAS
jgi:predicted GIY-YIG superfamily endonuclease